MRTVRSMVVISAICIALCSCNLPASNRLSEVSERGQDIHTDESAATGDHLPNNTDTETVDNRFLEALSQAVFNKEMELPAWVADSFQADVFAIVQKGRLRVDRDSALDYALLGGDGAFFWCVDSGDDIAIHYLGDTFRIFSELSLADIDGDGADETIAHFQTLAAHGPSSASCIMKYQNGEIATLLLADGTNEGEQQVNCPDLGFEIAFRDGYQYCITNFLTGYEKIVSIQEQDGPWSVIFDDHGNVNTEHPLYGHYFERDVPAKNLCLASNFLIFTPHDFDGDEVFEIIAAQQFVQNMQMDYILGTCYGVLRYNPASGAFDVIRSLFLTSEEHTVSDAVIPEQLMTEGRDAAPVQSAVNGHPISAHTAFGDLSAKEQDHWLSLLNVPPARTYSVGGQIDTEPYGQLSNGALSPDLQHFAMPYFQVDEETLATGGDSGNQTNWVVVHSYNGEQELAFEYNLHPNNYSFMVSNVWVNHTTVLINGSVLYDIERKEKVYLDYPDTEFIQFKADSANTDSLTMFGWYMLSCAPDSNGRYIAFVLQSVDDRQKVFVYDCRDALWMEADYEPLDRHIGEGNDHFYRYEWGQRTASVQWDNSILLIQVHTQDTASPEVYSYNPETQRLI